MGATAARLRLPAADLPVASRVGRGGGPDGLDGLASLQPRLDFRLTPAARVRSQTNGGGEPSFAHPDG